MRRVHEQVSDDEVDGVLFRAAKRQPTIDFTLYEAHVVDEGDARPLRLRLTLKPVELELPAVAMRRLAPPTLATPPAPTPAPTPAPAPRPAKRPSPTLREQLEAAEQRNAADQKKMAQLAAENAALKARYDQYKATLQARIRVLQTKVEARFALQQKTIATLTSYANALREDWTIRGHPPLLRRAPPAAPRPPPAVDAATLNGTPLPPPPGSISTNPKPVCQ